MCPPSNHSPDRRGDASPEAAAAGRGEEGGAKDGGGGGVVPSACAGNDVVVAPKGGQTKAPPVGESLMPLPRRPWWRRGGMHVNMVGMGFNTFVPLAYLASRLPEEERQAFAALLCLSWASALLVGCRTVYCVLVVPSFLSSLLLCARLGDGEGGSPLERPALALAAAVALAIAKVNICMSVCLHRYAAHAAFRCGPLADAALNVLGCLANQGGPIWWASQHRCHHKYCDLPRDPHSPVLVGTEAAFSFHETHPAVEEEFAPRHLESGWNRFLDTWSWCAVAADMAAMRHLFGDGGLFLAYASGWICQTITLWFNVANHPPEGPLRCKASDGKGALSSYYLPFHLLDALYPLFGVFVAEGEHKHHHDNAGLAKRKPDDLAYWTFIAPLEMLGIVWNVNK